MGVLNDPDCTAATQPDEFGLWLDVTRWQLDLDPSGAPPAAPGLDLGGGLA